MKDFFNRHEKVALMFSGGRDSLACLHLIKDYLDKTILIWVNTGAAFPEIIEMMKVIRSSVPNFLEVQTDQPASIAKHGYPADIVPISYSSYGQACTKSKPIKIRSYMECCHDNFWKPADDTARKLGVTAIVRGQRSDEAHRSPFKSGDTFDGIEYYFPIKDWDNSKVTKFLEANNVEITERLSMAHSSLDCWNCTAYCGDSKERMKYIKKFHPEKHKEVTSIIRQISQAVALDMAGIHEILEI